MKTRHVIGIDEAGRGPLAGPVTLACVLCPARLYRRNFKNIRDSKKLSAPKREEWFRHLKKHPHLKLGVTSVGHSMIDKKGISKAVKIGINRLLRKFSENYKLKTNSYKLLLDGSLSAPPEYNQRTIIKGDEKIPVIAAASIIAKVTRDRKMIRLAKKFPKYSFEIHKGYGTALHRRLVKKHGLCDIHRRSFCTRII